MIGYLERKIMRPMGLVVAAVVVIAALVGGFLTYNFATVEEGVQVNVTGKERVQDTDASRYLVYTDGEVFENTDNLLFGKFDSSDTYGRIAEGDVYECKVNGWRFAPLSMYRNLLDCDKVSA